MVLSPLKPAMTTPVINQFPDGHLRKTIYGLGPDICDYPEQVTHANIVYGWCTRYVILFLCLSDTHVDFRSCISDPSDLDQMLLDRTVEHTEHLVENFSRKEIWDNYGIVADLIVSIVSSSKKLKMLNY